MNPQEMTPDQQQEYMRWLNEYNEGNIDRAEFVVRVRAITEGFDEIQIGRRVMTRRGFKKAGRILYKVLTLGLK